jgi:uncharacterized iron-regulated membrane protein
VGGGIERAALLDALECRHSDWHRDPLFFSITGALLAYERPILHAMDKRYCRTEPIPSGAARMPLAPLIAETESFAHAPVEAVTVHPEPASPVEIQTANRNVFFADPYSGAVQGPVSPRLRAFFAQMTAAHRWFGLSNARQTTAMAVKGAVVMLFLFMVASGAVLWIPGRWNHHTVRTGIVPRFDTHGRARNYNWHKVTGFWLGLPLAVIAMTGIIMAYLWANALLFRIAGSPVPVPKAPRENSRHHASVVPTHFDEAFAQAVSGVDGWQSTTFRLGQNAGELNFTVDRGDGGQPEKREQVFVDASTEQVVRRVPFTALSRGQRWRSWVRFVHTGEAGGWWGETFAMVTALGAVMLSVTGFLLSFARLRRSRHRGAVHKVTVT